MFKKLFSHFNTKKRSTTELIPESLYEVTISDEDVTVVRPDGKIESVEWSDLRGVVIETTDAGPFAPDVFWVLVGTKSGCVVPQGANGEPALLERLQELPDFDNEQLIAAMVSAENARFVCWKSEE